MKKNNKFKIMKNNSSTLHESASEKFLKSLTPFEQWIYFSKDMGSMSARQDYLLSDSGKKELQKKFGKNLDKMPNDWEELKSRIEYDTGKDIRDFLKTLLKIFANSWGTW